jgi:hypothetical protein
MRIAGISSLEEANAFLPGFITRFNARFAVEPADPEPAFRPAPPPGPLPYNLHPSLSVALQYQTRAILGDLLSREKAALLSLTLWSLTSLRRIKNGKFNYRNFTLKLNFGPFYYDIFPVPRQKRQAKALLNSNPIL